MAYLTEPTWCMPMSPAIYPIPEARRRATVAELSRFLSQQGSVAQTSATSTPLTEQQIVAAGINPNDPANQNVYQFTINLAFGGRPDNADHQLLR